MRLRISLFELLLLVTPAFAITLGLLMAAINAPAAMYVLTIAQGVYLMAMLLAVCALFDRRTGVRVFSGAFLAASLGHLLLVWLSNQSAYAGSFPTTAGLRAIVTYVNPELTANVINNQIVYSGIWPTYPDWGGSGISGGFSGPGGPNYTGMGGGSTIYSYPTLPARPMFIEVGIWACSLLLGVLCGVAAKSLHGRRTEPDSSPASGNSP